MVSSHATSRTKEMPLTNIPATTGSPATNSALSIDPRRLFRWRDEQAITPLDHCNRALANDLAIALEKGELRRSGGIRRKMNQGCGSALLHGLTEFNQRFEHPVVQRIDEVCSAVDVHEPRHHRRRRGDRCTSQDSEMPEKRRPSRWRDSAVRGGLVVALDVFAQRVAATPRGRWRSSGPWAARRRLRRRRRPWRRRKKSPA